MIKSDAETRTYSRAYGRRIEKFLTKNLHDMAESRDRFSIQQLSRQLSECSDTINQKLAECTDVVKLGDANFRKRTD